MYTIKLQRLLIQPEQTFLLYLNNKHDQNNKNKRNAFAFMKLTATEYKHHKLNNTINSSHLQSNKWMNSIFVMLQQKKNQ